MNHHRQLLIFVSLYQPLIVYKRKFQTRKKTIDTICQIGRW